MIKFMILFRQPDDIDKFENVYQDFLALVERMPHIQRRQVVHVTGSPQGAPEYYRILEIYFETSDKQTEALMSPVGQEAGGELNRLPKDSFQLLMADVYEEAGGSSPRAVDDEASEPEDTSAADDADEQLAEADSDTVAASSAD
ncbi:MAG: EthD family reductase [Chloroflexi bacterium]|nr:EthD family reductase [Chloroflexota bacterium]